FGFQVHEFGSSLPVYIYFPAFFILIRFHSSFVHLSPHSTSTSSSSSSLPIARSPPSCFSLLRFYHRCSPPPPPSMPPRKRTRTADTPPASSSVAVGDMNAHELRAFASIRSIQLPPSASVDTLRNAIRSHTAADDRPS